MEDILEEIIVSKLNNHLKLLFNAIEKKYGEECGLRSDTLYTDYSIKSLKSIRTYKRKIKFVAPLELDLEHKCNARVWGVGIPRVVFNEGTNKWEYGLQCQRSRLQGMEYCGIHKKNRPHGNILERPPHDEFERHKKIDLKIKEDK